MATPAPLQCGACNSRNVVCAGLECPFFHAFPSEKSENFKVLAEHFGEDNIVQALSMKKDMQQAALKSMLSEARAVQALLKALHKAESAVFVRRNLLTGKGVDFILPNDRVQECATRLNEFRERIVPNDIWQATVGPQVVINPNHEEEHADEEENEDAA